VTPTATERPPARRRRSQKERSDTTIAEVLDAAREMFARDGYAVTSLDTVCAAAGVSRGAIYYHFTDKRQLFRTVYEREQRRLARVVVAAYEQHAEDPWEGVYQGSQAFLRATLDPSVQRIVLLDAPTALGPRTVRQAGSTCLNMMIIGIAHATGPRPQAVEPLAHLLYGVVCESAMTVARAEHPQQALAETLTELRAIFEALAAARTG
jgi:AcrR family transcriptional regulator